ncbi:hypothetical protein K9O30_20250 [Clostridium bowmanii]|uniref:hypothetical protein n=1 Tax=Clostridium bowmanii TaxID=132925 RepID=UPI001C0D90E9|nr:hypothetical protein [Clostridium bowmanii]MBU3191663.1 hypothetical protein [Clostridium bowmanii]MCA1076007.1 hypothetical protein [Clostridium bowmanii]
MKKIVYILLLVSLMSLSLLGCSKKDSNLITKEQYKTENKLNDSVVTREIDISKNKNLEFKKEINNLTKINGVYGYDNESYGLFSNNENKKIIFFNGIDGFYSDVNFSIENRVLTISYKYNTEKGLNKKSLFVVDDSNKDKSYDKVDLYKDGKQDAYVTIY